MLPRNLRRRVSALQEHTIPAVRSDARVAADVLAQLAEEHGVRRLRNASLGGRPERGSSPAALERTIRETVEAAAPVEADHDRSGVTSGAGQVVTRARPVRLERPGGRESRRARSGVVDLLDQRERWLGCRVGDRARHVVTRAQGFQLLGGQYDNLEADVIRERLTARARAERIPLQVEMEIIATCNYKCTHCYIAPCADRGVRFQFTLPLADRNNADSDAR